MKEQDNENGLVIETVGGNSEGEEMPKNPFLNDDEEVSGLGGVVIKTAGGSKFAKSTIPSPKLKPKVKSATVEPRETAVTEEPTEPAPPVPGTFVREDGTVCCGICKKPLTRGKSIEQGMGDVCAHKIALLAPGATLEKHYASKTVTELPPGYVKFMDAAKVAKAFGISGYRFLQVCGGDRHIRPALNKHFEVIFFEGKRYIPASYDMHLKEVEKI